jgi:hypothetical protein
MLVSELFDEVGDILNDMEVGSEHPRWPISDLIQYLNEASSTIALAKPSVFTTVVELALGPGSTQRLPDQFSRLLDIHFNINRNGTEGPNVLPGVYALQQAFQKPGCRYSGVVETYSAYPGSERFFWVDPPVPKSLPYTPKVEALVVSLPPVVTSPDQPLVFPGIDSQMYQGALVDWMLYRCYAKDQESPSSLQRSQMHFTAYQAYMGMAMGAPAQSSKSSGPAPARARA